MKSTDISKLVQEFYFKFISQLDHETLRELTTAANFMAIPSLMDLCCAMIASLIKDHTPAQIRVNLKLSSNFTAAQLEAIEAENKWAKDL